MARKPGGGVLDDTDADGSAYYESNAVCDEYLAFHYPASDPLAPLLGGATPPLSERLPFGLPRFWEARPDGVALDVGAATGRVTLDLARDHRAAWGIDFSRALIRRARAVQRDGRARYRTVVEGDLADTCDVAVETAPNAAFAVADAQALPFPDGRFDTVVAVNLVDRVPDPARVLDELARVTRAGGLLLVASPFTWMERFTPRACWLGGYRAAGKDIRGFLAVRERLAPACAFEQEAKVPFFIPHHARSGQLGLAHLQTFRRNP